MRRHSNWPERLAAFLEARRNVPFQWGVNDCGLFAADAIQAMTGVDLADDFRLQYDTALSAKKQIKKTLTQSGNPENAGGLEALTARICAVHGLEEIPVELAQRGDLLLGDLPTHGATLGIVGFTGQAVFVGRHGLMEGLLAHCQRAWRVA